MKTDIIIRDIENGKYDEVFIDIYADTACIDCQKKRYIDAVKKFEEIYNEKEVQIFSAPGRCEIGGNHTDHQNGIVLATAINLDAIGVVSGNSDNKVNIASEGFGVIHISLDELGERTDERGSTKALVKGVLSEMSKCGYIVGGFDVYITSDVPMGSGLSSSASFEVLIGTIISGLYNDMQISPVEIAMMGQSAENKYFGKPCGLMDQMVCAIGNVVLIDFLEIDSIKVEKINIDLDKCGYSLCITDTKGSHENLTDEYASIPMEMKNVAKHFGKLTLRGITKEMLTKDINVLRETVGDRAVLRSLHFVTENDRAYREAEYLKENNIKAFLKEVNASGNSSHKYLQNIYSSTKVQSQAVTLALGFSEEILEDDEACRVHGGGFAGTIIAFVKKENEILYIKEMENIFGAGSCKTLKIRKYGGIKVF
ncbi:MAG: galactokinase [Lachnospiraceae bacterium]|nr:galactokinase [Lachnospiraceae bacterium]